MADVKWIKIVTDVFDNRKIKLIRKMPEGDAIVVTWFQLLCLAGETNDNGLIYITKAIPYTEETLASAFDSPIAVVRLALQTFESLEMVTISNSFYCVANWEKYQNVDGLTKIKEQTRVRVAKHRQKQKELTECNVTVALPVTHCNATEEELEEDEDIDKENTPLPPKKTKEPKVQWADNVTMTNEEHKRLLDTHGTADTARLIEILDNYKGSTGKHYKDDYRAILSWCVDRLAEEKGRSSKPPQKNGPQAGTQDPKCVSEQVDWMKKFLANQKGGDAQ